MGNNEAKYSLKDIFNRQFSDAINNNVKTVATAGTAEALTTSISCHKVYVKALGTNTNPVFIGNASVDSSNGYPLDADEYVEIFIDDAAKIFVDVTTNGEGVKFIAS